MERSIGIGDRFRELVRQLSEGLHEREEWLSVALLAVLAGQNVCLLGPPGTGKSLMARRLSCAFQGAQHFEYLMQKFSTPEEIFGPIDIAELKKGNYHRKVDGYLPAADFAFLDEIWKSNPPILNTLLAITNEKIFRNGDAVMRDLPLKALIGASNETPPPGEGLDALWDRFVVRLYIDRLARPDSFVSLLQGGSVRLDVQVAPELAVSAEEWRRWQTEIGRVTLSPETLQAVALIKHELDELERQNERHDLEFYVSDRRWQRAVMLVKASAWFSGRTGTTHLDTLLLRHCLWNSCGGPGCDHGQRCTPELVEEIVTRHVGSSLIPQVSFAEVDRLLEKADDAERREDFGEGLVTIRGSIDEMQRQLGLHDDLLDLYLQKGLVPGDAERFRQALQTVQGEVSFRKQWVERLLAAPPLPASSRTYTCPITDMEFVLVKGGAFEMGDLFGDGRVNERPVHTVTVDDFYMGRYPVTQREWSKLMPFNPSRTKRDDLPVADVPWDQARRFINELNRKIKGGGGYRLPLEAEWEYAARSGGRKEKFAGNGNPNEVAWYEGNLSSSWDNGQSGTAPVGLKQPNGLGIYDMCGNVSEWCQDFYRDNYYTVSPDRNPPGPVEALFHVHRGGDCRSSPEDIRTTRRHNSSFKNTGFRLVLPAASTAPSTGGDR